MKHPALPHQPQHGAFIAPCFALIGWLFHLILKLGDPRRSMRLRRGIEYAERCVEKIIFLRAVAVMPPLPPARTRRPSNAPPGFRRARRDKRLFFKHAHVAMRRQSFLKRITRLIAVLANPKRYVARFLKRILKGLRLGALIAVAPLTHDFISVLRAAPLPADSS